MIWLFDANQSIIGQMCNRALCTFRWHSTRSTKADLFADFHVKEFSEKWQIINFTIRNQDHSIGKIIFFSYEGQLSGEQFMIRQWKHFDLRNHRNLSSSGRMMKFNRGLIDVKKIILLSGWFVMSLFYPRTVSLTTMWMKEID